MEDCPISSISDRGYHGTNADASACSTARLTSASELTTAGDPHSEGGYAAAINTGVSPTSGHPNEPAGSRASAVHASVASRLCPDDERMAEKSLQLPSPILSQTQLR
ncbi:hypothetical protein ACP70R_022369 [Stipagrostis hirtigluma subsp. patula]